MAKKRRIVSTGILRVVAAAGLGIIVTIVVSWKFSREAIYQRTQAPTRIWSSMSSGDSFWIYDVRRGTGWLQINSSVAGMDLPDTDKLTIDRSLAAPPWSKPSNASSDDPTSYTDGQSILRWCDVATGWPMLALRFREQTATPTTSITTTTSLGGQVQARATTTIQYGHRIIDRFGIHNILPLRPVFPGFIVNALIFTIPSYLLLLLAGPVVAMGRRARRRRKGLCIACGYDLSGLDGTLCPECGQAQTLATIEARSETAASEND